MKNLKDKLIGDKKIDKLEQIFIENLTCYKDLIQQIKNIQPNLFIGSIFRENICWIIGNSERMKQDGKIREYKLKWYKNSLLIVYIDLRNKITVIVIDLIRNRLFHESFTNNIQIYKIGVKND